MVKQHIHIAFKKLGLLFICLLSFISVSCSKSIPEGDIKDFVDRINYDQTFQHVNSGKSIITATYYIDDKIDGQICSTTYFDKTEDSLYHYINTDVSGSFIGNKGGQYAYCNQQILSYLESEDNVKVFKKTDGIDEDIFYHFEDLNTAINNFFYSELEAGYHRGGVYYGDYVIANCGKFYSCFSLNEDKTLLRYQVNTSSINSEGDEIVTMHDFIVDEYGMIITLLSKSIYLARNIIMETTISCEYNIEIEKIKTL